MFAACWSTRGLLQEKYKQRGARTIPPLHRTGQNRCLTNFRPKIFFEKSSKSHPKWKFSKRYFVDSIHRNDRVTWSFLYIWQFKWWKSTIWWTNTRDGPCMIVNIFFSFKDIDEMFASSWSTGGLLQEKYKQGGAGAIPPLHWIGQNRCWPDLSEIFFPKNLLSPIEKKCSFSFRFVMFPGRLRSP